MTRSRMMLVMAVVLVLLATGNALAQREFLGTVEAMPSSGYVGEWVISGRTVQVTPGTQLDFRGGPPQMGQVVKVEGREVDGVYVARELKTRIKGRGRR